MCLQVACFDPLVDPVPPLLGVFPSSVRPSGTGSTHEYRLVQRWSAASPTWFDDLTDAAWEAVGYVPRRTAITRVPNGTPPLGGDLVPRWQGLFLPAYRLSRDARDAWLTGPEPWQRWDDDKFRIHAAFFQGDDPGTYESDVIAQLPAGSVLESMLPPIPDLQPWGEMVVAADANVVGAAIEVLATTSGTQWVDITGPGSEDIDESIWFLQTGVPDVGSSKDFDTTAVAFRHGLIGAGEVGGVTDFGFHHAQCYFTDRGTGDSRDPLDVVWDTTGELAVSSDAPAGKTITNYRLVESPGEQHVYRSYHGTRACGAMLGDASPCDAVFDDPFDSEDCPPSFFGRDVQHHDVGDGIAPGAQLVFQAVHSFPNAYWTESFQQRVSQQAYETLGQFGTGVRVHNRSHGVKGTRAYTGPAVGLDMFAWTRRDSVATLSMGNSNSLFSFDFPPFFRAPSLGNLAESKSGLSIGAGQRASYDDLFGEGEDMAFYSSRGPGADSRVKPDVVTPGGDAGSLALMLPGRPGLPVGSSYDPGAPDCHAEQTGNEGSGTSFAAPSAGGLALQVRQYLRQAYYPSGMPCASDTGGFNPTNALVKAVLVNSARNMTGLYTSDNTLDPNPLQADRPTFGQGWGRPVLGDALFFPGDPRGVSPFERTYTCVLTDTPNGVVDPAELNDRRRHVVAEMKPAIETGQIHEFTIEVLGGEDLHVTLAWSDPPPALAAGDPQVNDLDLEVVRSDPGSPTGVVVWRPNAGTSSMPVGHVDHDPTRTWAGGYTVLGTASDTCGAPGPERGYPQAAPFCDFVHRDRRNQVENIFLPASVAVAGTYTVRVIAYQVASSPQVASANAFPNLINTDGSPKDDPIQSRHQGYALVASGRVLVDRGFVHFGSAFHECGEVLTLTLNDRDAAAGATATLRSFVGPHEDIETITFPAGPLPQVTIPLQRADGPADWLPGGADVSNGTLKILPEAWITAEYADASPAGHVAHACTRIGSIGAAMPTLGADLFDPCGDGDGLALERGDLTYVDVKVFDPGAPTVRVLQGFLTTTDPDVVIGPDRAVFTQDVATIWVARFAVTVGMAHACPATIPFTLHLRGDSGCSGDFTLDLNAACGTGTTQARPAEVYPGPWVGPPASPIPLLVSKIGSNAIQLEWDGGGAAAFNLYRGRLDLLVQTRAYNHHASALEGAGDCGIPVASFTDLDDGSVMFPEPFYYLVANTVACAGAHLDGPLGFDSFGRERPLGGGCP